MSPTTPTSGSARHTAGRLRARNALPASAQAARGQRSDLHALSDRNLLQLLRVSIL